MTNTRTGALIVISMLLTACKMTQPVDSAVRKSIAQVNAQFNAAFNKQDASTLASLYTLDAQLYPPNESVIHGRDAIGETWQMLFDAGFSNLSIETVELSPSQNQVVEVGAYSVSMFHGEAFDRGNFFVVWKKEDGQWKLHRDIWNSRLPLPGTDETDDESEEVAMGKPVVHFEIGCRDSSKTQNFYSDLFQWDIVPAGMSAMITTGSEDGIGGHITALGHEPFNYILFYVQVDDIQSHLDKAETLGGKTVIGPLEIPGGIGHFAWFTDPDGNTIGLFKPSQTN